MNAGMWVLKPFVMLFSITVCVPSAPAGQTPETRTLTAGEAARALQRDWLFQALGEPLLARAAKEIGWGRELAERLARGQLAPDLSEELGELDALERRVGELSVGFPGDRAVADPSPRRHGPGH